MEFENEKQIESRKGNLTVLHSSFGEVDSKTTEPLVKIFNANAYFTNITAEKVFSKSADGIISAISKSYLQIINSTFTHNKVMGSIIHLDEKSLLYLSNCEIEENHANDSAINLFDSEGEFRNCSFGSNRGNTETSGAAIYVTNYQGTTFKSAIHNNRVDKSFEARSLVFDCSFVNNEAEIGGAIYVSFGASIHILNSVFSNNSAANGGAIYAVQDTLVLIEKSFFHNNHGWGNAGCIGCKNGVVIQIISSLFNNNIAEKDGGVLYAETNNSIYIYQSLLTLNKGQNNGVMSVIDRAELLIDRCTFDKNIAEVSTSVLTTYASNLTIQNTIFTSNDGLISGALSIISSFALLENVQFKNNSAVKGSCIFIAATTRMNVTNTTFSDNKQGTLINSKSKSILNLKDCAMSNHTLSIDTLIEIVQSYLFVERCIFSHNQMGLNGGVASITGKSGALINSCLFENITARYGAVFYIKESSDLQIRNSNFLYNTGMFGGCIYAEDSLLNIVGSTFVNNTAKVHGGAIQSLRTKTNVKFSSFLYHGAYTGGIIYLNDSTLMAYESIFRSGDARMGGAIYKSHTGKVVVDHCSFIMNNGVYGGAIYFLESNSLKISNSICKYVPEIECQGKRGCIDFDIYIQRYNVDFCTLNFTISNIKKEISSTETNFINRTLDNKMIFMPGAILDWKESVFASSEFCILLVGDTVSWVLQKKHSCLCVVTLLLSSSSLLSFLCHLWH